MSKTKIIALVIGVVIVVSLVALFFGQAIIPLHPRVAVISLTGPIQESGGGLAVSGRWHQPGTGAGIAGAGGEGWQHQGGYVANREPRRIYSRISRDRRHDKGFRKTYCRLYG
ncbi:MAG: hypothetical protein AAGB97_00655 [Dehalococcoidia bacterium]